MSSKTISSDPAAVDQPQQQPSEMTAPVPDHLPPLFDCLTSIFLRFFDRILDVPAEQRAERAAFDRESLETKLLYSVSDAAEVSKTLRELGLRGCRTPVLTVSGLIRRLLPEFSILVDDGYSQAQIADVLHVEVLGPPFIGRLSERALDIPVDQHSDLEAFDRQLLENTPVYSVADAEKLSKRLIQLARSRALTPVLTVHDLLRRLAPELSALFGNGYPRDVLFH